MADRDEELVDLACLHDDADIDILSGRANCPRCGRAWWASRAEIEAQRAHEIAYQQEMENG